MSSASTSPISDRRGDQHIETTSLRHSLQGPTTSPRNAVLSQTSLPRPAAEPTASITDSRSRDARALEKRWDTHKKSSDRKKRSTAHSDLLTNLSRLELDRIRNDPRAETLKMRDLLDTAVRQVHIESKRAEELQRINDETALKFRVLNDNRVSAQQEASKVKTELKLYQYQLDNAQKEIEKAKTALKEIERQRDEAEDAAARARGKARRYQQEMQVAAAREEGRRLGYEAGLKHAKKEKEILSVARSRGSAPRPASSRKGKERAYYPEDYGRSGPPRHHSHARNDTASSLEDSPSPTSKQKFRGSNQPAIPRRQVRNAPATMPPPSRPRPETEEEEEEDDYESESEESPPPSRPARPKTPSIQYWPVDIPAADRLDDSFNSNENANNAIHQGPREKWVTAHQHREIRGSPNPPIQTDHVQTVSKSPIPVLQTSHPLSPTDQTIPQGPKVSVAPVAVPPPPVIILRPAGPTVAARPSPPKAPLMKSVKFWARKPSLAKTKQQATSWYRSFSLRKKTRPVIDPIAEEPISPLTDAPATFAAPEIQAVAVDSPEAVKLYGPNAQQSQSWYRSSAPPSLRNHDISFARRQQSDAASVSTRVSQFDLLATPAQQIAASVSLPRPKNKGQVKEKESLLSVIREDASRGNTPERSLGVGGTGGHHSMSQPNFGQLSGFQSDSFPTQNRQSHRPPSIFVPDPDAVLPPTGAGIGTHQRYPSNTSLLGKPSIDIDVVPPSGMAPDTGTSPPHTGRNHLSPYHVFHSGESTRSFRNAVNTDHPPRSDSAATNRRPGHARSASGPVIHDPYGSPLQAPQAPFMTRNHDPNRNPSRPGSVRPSTSNRHLRNTSSTATFKIANPDPSPDPEPDSRSTRTRTPGRSHPVLADVVAAGNGAAVVLTPRRETSRASIKSAKSYSRYNPEEYVDPAYWGVNGPGDPPAALPAQPRPGMLVDADDMERAASRLSRKTSINSGLSYA